MLILHKENAEESALFFTTNVVTNNMRAWQSHILVTWQSHILVTWSDE